MKSAGCFCNYLKNSYFFSLLVNLKGRKKERKRGFLLVEMTQDERWNLRYQEVMEFIETNHRNPSKHRLEEHDMLNWLKANRKALNAEKMKPERVEKFRKLLAMTEQYRRKNQYE